MKTRSNRYRCKSEGERLDAVKRKFVFKSIQMLISISMSTLIFAVLKEYYLSPDILIRLLQVFIISFASVMTSNFVALGITVSLYHVNDIRSFLSRERSYTKFFLISVLYAFSSSIAFTFGIFWVIYYAFGDGSTLTLILMYAAGYFVIEFFSYGVVTAAHNATNAWKTVQVIR